MYFASYHYFTYVTSNIQAAKLLDLPEDSIKANDIKDDIKERQLYEKYV